MEFTREEYNVNMHSADVEREALNKVDDVIQILLNSNSDDDINCACKNLVTCIAPYRNYCSSKLYHKFFSAFVDCLKNDISIKSRLKIIDLINSQFRPFAIQIDKDPESYFDKLLESLFQVLFKQVEEDEKYKDVKNNTNSTKSQSDVISEDELKHKDNESQNIDSNTVNEEKEDENIMLPKLFSKQIIKGLLTLINNILLKCNSNQNIQPIAHLLLGSLQALSCYGLQEYSVDISAFSSHLNFKLMNLNAFSITSQPTTKKKKRKQQPIDFSDVSEENKVGVNVFHDLNLRKELLDLELSDFQNQDLEAFEYKKIFRYIDGKIRLKCYYALENTLALLNKQVIFGYWSLFFADLPNNIFTLILKDANSKVRYSALTFLKSLLSSGQAFVFKLAKEDKLHFRHAFTSVSHNLATLLKEMHQNIARIFVSENDPQALSQVYSCMSILVTITPYHECNSNLLSNLLNHSLLIHRNDDIIQKACVSFYSTVFTLDPVPNQLHDWMKSEESQVIIKKLISFLLDHVQSSKSKLFNHSLKFFSALLRHDLKHLFNLQNSMKIATDICSLTSIINSPNVHSQTSKYLQSLALSLKTNSVLEVNEQEIILWWTTILSCPFFLEAIDNTRSKVSTSCRCSLIDFIAMISENHFNRANDNFQKSLINLIENNCVMNKKESYPVCASAIRCLGLFSAFDTIRNQTDLLYHFFQIANKLAVSVTKKFDKSNDLHWLLYQITWTMANISDNVYKCSYDDNLINDLFLFGTNEVCLEIMKLELIGMKGQNIKTNVVRCFNFLILIMLKRIDEKSLEESLKCKNMIIDSTLVLIEAFQSKADKLLWNLCHVFSSLLTQPYYCMVVGVHLHDNQNLMTQIFNTLLSLLQESANHKVQAYSVDAIFQALQAKSYLNVDHAQLFEILAQFFITKYAFIPERHKSIWIEKFSAILIYLIDLTSNLNLNETIWQSLKQFFQRIHFCESKHLKFKKFSQLRQIIKDR